MKTKFKKWYDRQAKDGFDVSEDRAQYIWDETIKQVTRMLRSECRRGYCEEYVVNAIKELKSDTNWL